MDTSRAKTIARYLFTPEDSILTRPESLAAGGVLPTVKTALWIVVAISTGLTLARLT
jgi:hypothetical protein